MLTTSYSGTPSPSPTWNIRLAGLTVSTPAVSPVVDVDHFVLRDLLALTNLEHPPQLSPSQHLVSLQSVLFLGQRLVSGPCQCEEVEADQGRHQSSGLSSPPRATTQHYTWVVGSVGRGLGLAGAGGGWRGGGLL